MADTNETIAEIIAAKRRLAAEMEKALGDQHSSVEMLKDDADRLEAAVKRECGDCAKLRDALVSAIGTLKKLYAPSKRTAGHIVTCRQKCEAALATISNQNIQEQ